MGSRVAFLCYASVFTASALVGAADDKAGVMAHIAALRAHRGALPVGVTVFVEGEEEIGSASLETILERHGDRLRGDAIILADSMN